MSQSHLDFVKDTDIDSVQSHLPNSTHSIVEDIIDELLYTTVHQHHSHCETSRNSINLIDRAIEYSGKELLLVFDLLENDNRVENEELVVENSNSMFYLYNTYYRNHTDISSTSPSPVVGDNCVVSPSIDTWARAAVSSMNAGSYHRKPWSVAAATNVESRRRLEHNFRDRINSSSSATSSTSTFQDANITEKKEKTLKSVISSFKLQAADPERKETSNNSNHMFKLNVEKAMMDKHRLHNAQNDILVPKVVHVRKRGTAGRSAEMRHKLKTDNLSEVLFEKYAEYNYFVQKGEMFLNCQSKRPFSAPSRPKKNIQSSSTRPDYVQDDNVSRLQSKVSRSYSARPSQRVQIPQNKAYSDDYVDADIDARTVRARSAHNSRLDRQRRERLGTGGKKETALGSSRILINDINNPRPRSAIPITSTTIHKKIEKAFKSHVDRIKGRQENLPSHQMNM